MRHANEYIPNAFMIYDHISFIRKEKLISNSCNDETETEEEKKQSENRNCIYSHILAKKKNGAMDFAVKFGYSEKSSKKRVVVVVSHLHYGFVTTIKPKTVR